MASGSQNNTTYQAQKWTNLRAFTIGNTTKNVDGTEAVSWSKDEILGASTDAYFLRGDKVWSNTLNGVLLLPKGLKTGARVSDSGSGIVIDNDGGIEIFHTSAPFIDFHYQASTADYSVRLLCDSATNIHDSGSFTAGKYITAGGDITANGGYLFSTLNGNTVQIGSQNGSYAHFTNTKDIPFWFNKVIQSDGGFTIYNTGDNHWRNGYIKINNSGGGDCYVELRRSSNADWRILNSGGNLYFQSNWTSSKVAYFNVLQLDYNTGRAHFKEYVYASYFNASCGAETPADGSYWIFANSDGFFRKSTRTNLAAKIDIEHKWVRIGGDTMTGQLYINYNQDVNLGQNGSLIIGTKGGENVALDGNEIMARNNGTASTLYINSEGGQVYVGSGGINVTGQVAATWLRVVNNSSNNSDDAMVYIESKTTSDWAVKINKGGNRYGVYIDSLDQDDALRTNGYIRARCLWANQGSNGERQVGVDSSTSGTLYFYANTSGKGIYSGSGYQTGSILTINSSGKTFYGALSGNASTATTLQTARNINGTSFNGSANITTANWGTARNITIKDASSTNAGTAVSVNGSSAVTLLLPATIKASIIGNCSGSSGSCTGNAATANAINNDGGRRASSEYMHADGKIRFYLATSSMTTGKPPCDGFIMKGGWDNTGGWDSMFAWGNDGHGYIRGSSGSGNSTNHTQAWKAWNTLLDSSNYTSYTVTKTGSGASGTWSINITGSAGSVAWENVSSKPATATRWPTWSEVTSKPSVQNNLTSTSTTDMLSAAQGKALNDNKTAKGTGLAYTTLLNQTYAGTSYKSITVSNISSYNALHFACYFKSFWRGSMLIPINDFKSNQVTIFFMINGSTPEYANFKYISDTSIQISTDYGHSLVFRIWGAKTS